MKKVKAGVWDGCDIDDDAGLHLKAELQFVPMTER
jgi:hypothetical protein